MKKLFLIIILSLTAVAQTAAPSLTKSEQLERTLLLTRQQNLVLQQQILERDIAEFV